MAHEINKQFLDNIESLIETSSDEALLTLLSEEHPADIAEIIDELELDDATYLFKLLDSELTAEALMEINEDDREKILQNLTAKEIADEIDSQDGNYRKIGSMVNERLSKFSEDKQKELFNDLRAIDAVAKNKPVVFQKVLSGTPLSDYVIEGLLINNNNDPVKSMQAAENLGYKVE